MLETRSEAIGSLQCFECYEMFHTCKVIKPSPMTESVFIPTGICIESGIHFKILQIAERLENIRGSFPTRKQANVALFCLKAQFPSIVSLQEESSDVT